MTLKNSRIPRLPTRSEVARLAGERFLTTCLDPVTVEVSPVDEPGGPLVKGEVGDRTRHQSGNSVRTVRAPLAQHPADPDCQRSSHVFVSAYRLGRTPTPVPSALHAVPSKGHPVGSSTLQVLARSRTLFDREAVSSASTRCRASHLGCTSTAKLAYQAPPPPVS